MSGLTSEVQAQVPHTWEAPSLHSLIRQVSGGPQVVLSTQPLQELWMWGGGPSRPPRLLIPGWLGWVDEGASLGPEAEAR